jgi:ankyrin repeat protein
METRFVLLVACLAVGGCYTGLQRAANDGDPARVKDLLHAGAPINGQAHIMVGETALHRAVTGKSPGHVECVRLLLERGADPEIKTRGGHTVLCWAMSYENAAAVRLLIARGVDLHVACVQRNLDHLQQENGEAEVAVLVREAQEAKKEVREEPGNQEPPPEPPPAAEPPPPPSPTAPGCGKDTDCKGDRICVKGECVAPKR